jgi:hypothetical protein
MQQVQITIHGRGDGGTGAAKNAAKIGTILYAAS